LGDRRNPGDGVAVQLVIESLIEMGDTTIEFGKLRPEPTPRAGIPLARRSRQPVDEVGLPAKLRNILPQGFPAATRLERLWREHFEMMRQQKHQEHGGDIEHDKEMEDVAERRTAFLSRGCPWPAAPKPVSKLFPDGEHLADMSLPNSKDAYYP
jgi:hypothetical protein